MDITYHDQNRPHEARFHESIFDPLSRPFSRASSNNNNSKANNEKMGAFSDTKVPWDHFGKKLRIYFTKDELDRAPDLYQVLIRKIHDQRPEFQGAIAYNDQTGRQVIIFNDTHIRAALHNMKNKLKLYSTVTQDKGYIAAADMVRSPRSHSVPPHQARYSPDERSPSSVDTNYNYRHDRNSPQQSPQSPYPTYGSRQAPPSRNIASPGGVTYSSQGYGQHALYGMPPHNLLLAHFLTGGHYPFSRFSWIGPNKYHNFGPYPYKAFYNKGGWGPSW